MLAMIIGSVGLGVLILQTTGDYASVVGGILAYNMMFNA